MQIMSFNFAKSGCIQTYLTMDFFYCSSWFGNGFYGITSGSSDYDTY